MKTKTENAPDIIPLKLYFAPPKHVTDALADVAKGDNILLQQYTRGYVN